MILPSHQYFIINPSTDLNATTPQPNFRWGGKLVYNIDSTIINGIGGLQPIFDKSTDYLKHRLGL